MIVKETIEEVEEEERGIAEPNRRVLERFGTDIVYEKIGAFT
jgi:hypothetical protein